MGELVGGSKHTDSVDADVNQGNGTAARPTTDIAAADQTAARIGRTWRVADAPKGGDEILLMHLGRRAALADSVIVVLYFALAGACCRAWYGAHDSGQYEIDLVRAWLLPWFVAAAVSLALVALLTKRAGLAPMALGLHRGAMVAQVLWGVAGAILGCAAQFLWIGADVSLRRLLTGVGLPAPWSWEAAYAIGRGLSGLTVGTVLMTMSAAAVAEEVAFRGVLLTRLRRVTGRWWCAVLMCSLLFGVHHVSGGFAYVVGTAVVSAVFSVVFIRSRSLVAVVVAHFLYNMAQYAIGAR